MYLQHFGFHSRPFTLVPDIDRIIWRPDLRSQREQILDAIQSNAPLIVLTGEVGVGKTIFLSALLSNDIPETRHVVFRRGSGGDGNELLAFVAAVLPEAVRHDDPPLDRIAVTARKLPLLVIIDEAQAAAPEGVLELYRLANSDGRLTLLLTGQPELRSRLAGAEYRGLSLPSDHSHIIARLSEEEAMDYMTGRLERAGGSGNVIQPDAMALIARTAKRIPRMINKVADACLLLAFMDDRTTVDKSFAAHVIENILDPVTLALTITSSPAQPSRLVKRDTVPNEVPAVDDPMPEASKRLAPSKMQKASRDAAIAPETLDRSSDKRPTTSRCTNRSLLWLVGVTMAALIGTVPFFLAPDEGPIPRSLPNGSEARPNGSEPLVQSEGASGMIETDMSLVSTENGTSPSESSIPDRPKRLETAMATEAEAARLYARALSENDPIRSAIYYARAGVLGHERAALYMGQKYDTGDGVSFSPEIAARWYDVADNLKPSGTAAVDASSSVIPLQGTRRAGRIDLVWDGVAQTFDLELADAEYKTLGTARTLLTATSLVAEETAQFWRVRATEGVFSDWAPIVPDNE